jgi:hypothetical protein
MSVVIDLPPDVEAALRQSASNLNQAAKEALLIEMYREGRLLHSQFAAALGLSRDQANALLKQHCVHEDLPTPDEFRQQLASIGLGNPAP